MSTPRPTYRYLEPAPRVDAGFGRVVRWMVPLSGLLWLLILAAGFLVAKAVT